MILFCLCFVGRVRSKLGRVVAIFDKELRDKMKDNKIKEEWMNEALKTIRGKSITLRLFIFNG